MRTLPVGSRNWTALLVVAFFAALLLTGWLIYPDYGLSWDEPTQVELGIKTYRYVMKGDPALLEWRDRLYGPFFEILLVIFQSRGASREMYLSRHLLTFLAFWCGCLAFFWLAYRIYRKVGLALLGAALLVLSPRIFADAFYNSKDIPFLVLYVFALLSLTLLLDRPGPLTLFLHGAVTAALLATRLPGLVIPALTLGGLALEAWAGRLRWPRAARSSLLYLLLTFGLMTLFWPALWPDPPGEFIQALRMMSDFPHQTAMLYRGEIISSDNLPWHYLPVWIGISTPITHLLLAGAGLAAMLWRWARSPHCLRSVERRNELILLGSLFVPPVVVIGLGSTLYDGWRQMFFIYPPLLLVALRGVETGLALARRWLSAQRGVMLATALLLAALAPTAWWMAAHHPYQNLYFNRLTGESLRAAQQRYAFDYWGLTYREGLDYLLRADPAPRIAVFAETEPGMRSAALFPTEEETRLDFVKTLAEADYYIGNYDREKVYPFKDEIYTVWVGDAKALSVFRLREDEKD